MSDLALEPAALCRHARRSFANHLICAFARLHGCRAACRVQFPEHGFSRGLKLSKTLVPTAAAVHLTIQSERYIRIDGIGREAEILKKSQR